MRTQQFLGSAALLSCTIFLIVSSPAKAEAKEWVTLRDNIPQEIERVFLTLTFAPTDAQFYTASATNIKSTPIEGSRKKEDYKQQINLGRSVDGKRYELMLRNADDVNIISQNSDEFCMAKILRTTDDKKPETIREGLVSMQREVLIPLEVPAAQIGVPSAKPVKGEITINIYRNNPVVYESRPRTTLKGTLSGSTSTKTAFLNAAITCRDSLAIPDRYLTLSLKPFDDRAPISCNGKIGDMLMLGTAKLVVEKITSNCSELVLAVLDGEMEPVANVVETLATVGNPFPAFARVELVKRQLLTLEDLLSEAGPDGYVALVFGDFKQGMTMPGYYGGPPQPRTLSLDEKMILDILKRDCEKPVVLAFVCRQLSLTDLYEKWLGRDPEFFVLSDFSNPLDVLYIAGPEQHRYPRPNEQKETLGGSLNFENDKVITALLDGTGGLVCLDTDAAGTLSGSLVEMNTCIKQGKKAQKTEP